MSSEQMGRRRDNATDERQVLVEKDRVPKMASFFENLAEEAKASDKSPEFVSLADKASGDLRDRENEKEVRPASSVADEVAELAERRGEEKGSEAEAEVKEEPSLEEMSKMRAEAQQKLTEAIKAAEERYTNALRAARQGAEKSDDYPNESCIQKGLFVMEKGKEGGAAVKEAAETAAEYVGDKAAEAKEAAVSVVKGVADKAAEIAGMPIAAAIEVAREGSGGKQEEECYLPEDTKTEDDEVEETTGQTRSNYDQDTMSNGQSGSTTVLGAIGETIVEIARTTKDLVVG